MKKGMYLFESNLLPSGFIFPESYLDLLRRELPDIEPWWWLAPYKELSVSWLEILQEQFPDRMLIPFAKDGGSDDLACFDGLDISGEPQIFFIHSFCDPGWEDRGEMNNFNEWLKSMLEESKKFKLMEKKV